MIKIGVNLRITFGHFLEAAFEDSCWVHLGLIPLFSIDIGYPAFYHQYRTIPEYLDQGIMHVLNWPMAEKRFAEALKQTVDLADLRTVIESEHFAEKTMVMNIL